MSLKKVKFFFYKYNSIINTKSLYFILPFVYLPIVKFFYTQRLINFYKISNLNIYVYLPKKNVKPFKKLCDKHQKIFHSVKKVNPNGLYLTSLGFLYGQKVKQLKCGGRLLYS